MVNFLTAFNASLLKKNIYIFFSAWVKKNEKKNVCYKKKDFFFCRYRLFIILIFMFSRCYVLRTLIQFLDFGQSNYFRVSFYINCAGYFGGTNHHTSCYFISLPSAITNQQFYMGRICNLCELSGFDQLTIWEQ